MFQDIPIVKVRHFSIDNCTLIMLYFVEEVGYFHTVRKLESMLVIKSTNTLFLTYQVSFAKVVICYIAIRTG